MRIVWNERSWHWFVSASQYTGYNRQLSNLLLGSLPHGGTLCDIGCGAALVDFELAPYFGHISCVDRSSEILRYVDAEIQKRGLTNISTLCADGAKLKGKWDTVMALFHGGTDVILKYLPLTRDRLIIATNRSRIGGFGPKAYKVAKCFDIQGTKEYLEHMGIKYYLTEAELEYGQPLSDLEDAKAFIRAYTTPMEDSTLKAYMETALERTGRKDFPYYLPKKKSFGLFIIRRDENANIQRRC